MGDVYQPIAIIGLGCRFPGGCDSPEQYWDLLSGGREAISMTPADRWSLEKFYCGGRARPGKTQSRWGGYVRDIDRFDPELFRISPREASAMDPQQRMLLETAYRAAEDAGVPITKLAGRNVSVHVGISSIDYSVAALSAQDRAVIGPYSNTGGSSSIAANRISYCFDLRGESLAIDTACSSSLIAVHLACESLQDSENELAFAGGVNALLLPDFYVAFSQLGVLSPDGRCKTFDASANGYVRSEGAGMVLLKRLEDAVKDGDQIYAVIRGSATNQDGRTEGLTVPSGEAQASLIRKTMQRAGIDAADVSYVEAHGTGTSVGDPIEAFAIGSCYGDSSGTPCTIGSVKTNIGHLEAGAGIASVIKVALAIKQQTIPAHLNFATPNPAIDFDGLGLTVPKQTQQWQYEGIKAAGINGFGYGGANAHLILSEPTSIEVVQNGEVPAVASVNSSTASDYHCLPISGHSTGALTETAGRWASYLATGDASLESVVSTAWNRRTHHAFRAAAVAQDRDGLIAQLRQIETDPDGAVVEVNRSLNHSAVPKVAFVCSGQGPQWWAMGRQMLQICKPFSDVIDQCDREFAKHVDWSLRTELLRSEDQSRMQQTSIAQPALYAIQIALAAVWEDAGVRPDLVVGHSVGEIAAAYLSGALSFADAATVAVHRGRTMDLATSRGAMIAVGLSEKEVQPYLLGKEDQISIAAINGPTSLTLSGCKLAVEELASQLDQSNVFCRQLKVEYAFHSPLVDPVRDELLQSLAAIKPVENRCPMISTVTGRLIQGSKLDANYWWDNVRQPVYFADAMETMVDAGIQFAIELGPHPVLAYAIDECYAAHNATCVTVPSLNRKEDDLKQFAKSKGELFKAGFPASLFPGSLAGESSRPFHTTKLPSLAMVPRRLWLESVESRSMRTGDHWDAVLGNRCDDRLPTWQLRIDFEHQTILADHKVGQSCVLPAAALLRLCVAVGQQVHPDLLCTIANFQMEGACLLSSDQPQRLQTQYDPDRRRITISRSDVEQHEWHVIATADLCVSLIETKERPQSADLLRQSLPETISAEHLYNHCENLGLKYDHAFRGVVDATREDRHAIAKIKLPREREPGDQNDVFSVEASLLDCCFHAMVIADPAFDDPSGGLYLPSKIASVDVFSRIESDLVAVARIRSKNQYRMVADLAIYNAAGRRIASVHGFESVRVSGTEHGDSTSELLYRYCWKPAEKGDSENYLVGRKWLLFSDLSGLASQIVDQLPADDRVITVQHGTAFKRLGDDAFIIDPEDRNHFDRLLADVGEDVTDVVYFWGVDVPENAELDSNVLEKSTVLTSLAPLHLSAAWQQALDGGEQSSGARLTVITNGAQPTDQNTDSIVVAAGPLIGMTRVIASEVSRLTTRLVDLDLSSKRYREDLVDELICRTDREDEVMYRDSIRWVRRFEPAGKLPLRPESLARQRSKLQRGDSASIDQLHYRSDKQVDLAADELEIEVAAAGLNFSDVMKALDLYPGLPDGPPILGAECSGRVIRIGSEVGDFKVGDEVIAVAPGSFATHVQVKQDLVAAKPTRLSHAEAAALPIAFLTAEYALNDLARIRAGEKVLIHSASGGVGLAGMQLANLCGARIFATAGTDEKRDHVLKQGAEMVMDSRSLQFARQIQEKTRGDGVDVILNSLPGEAIRQGLSVLSIGGRFLEIGKRDIYSDAPLGMLPLRNNLSFLAIDLDQLIRHQPKRLGAMLRSLVDRFESGELQPLPIKVFEADETDQAFRFMQQAKHIGKVVIDYQAEPSRVFAKPGNTVSFKSDRTYWIAGGMGGFGLRVAQWLAENGAKHLVLGGRSQSLNPDVRRQVAEIESKYGVKVTHKPVDLSDAKALRLVAQEISSQMPPLAGVFHTAMVLEDRLLADLDRPTLERVLRPKVQGGWNLHEIASEYELDYFVLFSSLSSVFGHAGQANYSAANAFLDSLAHHRRFIGMHGVAINWGHVGEVGYLAARDELSQRLERQGVMTFSADEAMSCLQHALAEDVTDQSVLRMDWTKWRGLGLTGDVSLRFSHLLQGKADGLKNLNRLATIDEIREADPGDRQSLIEAVIGNKAAILLGIAAEELPWDRPLLNLGLDSLMAVEMRNWIESRLQIDMPIADLMRAEGLNDLALKALTAFNGGVDEVPSSETTTQELLDQLPSMSDESVDELLAKMLSESEGGLGGG
ncbi:type I polyketide synthase [Stieleria sp. JC731]|uniref:type I polyketide synthase n=1 Tax=Pirellulaceae TaxID=2691357 RepID=UPI001E2C553F|nr:type I polyketide synthase [Stieleria sp. JC731]MCC9602830.1 type I polyketide synthase [Stieleria sp. JC731]